MKRICRFINNDMVCVCVCVCVCAHQPAAQSVPAGCSPVARPRSDSSQTLGHYHSGRWRWHAAERCSPWEASRHPLPGCLGRTSPSSHGPGCPWRPAEAASRPSPRRPAGWTAGRHLAQCSESTQPRRWSRSPCRWPWGWRRGRRCVCSQGWTVWGWGRRTAACCRWCPAPRCVPQSAAAPSRFLSPCQWSTPQTPGSICRPQIDCGSPSASHGQWGSQWCRCRQSFRPLAGTVRPLPVCRGGRCREGPGLTPGCQSTCLAAVPQEPDTGCLWARRCRTPAGRPPGTEEPPTSALPCFHSTAPL